MRQDRNGGGTPAWGPRKAALQALWGEEGQGSIPERRGQGIQCPASPIQTKNPGEARQAPPAGRPPIREPSAAGRGWKRRNSHQSAVFAEGGNGTVVGISELVEEDGFEPSKAKPADLQSVPFGHLGTPPYEVVKKKVELVDGFEPPTC